MGPALGGLFGKPICLIAGDPRVGRDLKDRNLVAPAHNARADLDPRSGQVLTWANGIGPDLVDGCCRARKDGIAAAALLPSVEGLRRSEDGIGLRAERLAVAQVVTSACPPLQGVPGARRSYPSTVEPRPVGPDYVPVPSVAGRLQCRALFVNEDLAWKDLVPAPLLGLNCPSWSAAHRSLEARGEGCSVAGKDLLRALVTPWSGVSAWENLACR